MAPQEVVDLDVSATERSVTRAGEPAAAADVHQLRGGVLLSMAGGPFRATPGTAEVTGQPLPVTVLTMRNRLVD